MTTLIKALKPLLGVVPGGGLLYRFARRLDPRKTVPKRQLIRGAKNTPDFEQLAATYAESSLATAPETCVLYRIVGNDLAPRHRVGQSLENLRFILEHEQELVGCEKRFVVNRIVDPAVESAVLEVLEEAGAPYLHLPFSKEEYEAIGWDVEGIPLHYAPPVGRRYSRLSDLERGRLEMRLYRHKNNYVMNNNGARNAALRDGRRRAKWVLPWDGNCYFTASGWAALHEQLRLTPYLPYLVVPMVRLTDNQQILAPGFEPKAFEEPQVAFRCDASEEFDERYYYGRRPKVELLWRLGVPGDWDGWVLEPWDFPGPKYAADAEQFSSAGWVARLNSGQPKLERYSAMGKVNRGLARVTAVKGFLDALDDDYVKPRAVPRAALTSHAQDVRTQASGSNPLLSPLRQAAEQALQRGPFSVTHKTTLPPSKDPHDYWHPAPYYWPNPLTPSGRPYIRRDGVRVPGTRMYEPLSGQFDRTRLQYLFDDTRLLALAWQLFGEQRFAEHAAAHLRCWFLEAATAMRPHLTYAQVRYGYNGDQGNSSGIIELKDLYYYLDAVRVIEAAAVFTDSEMHRFREWLERYLQWLQTSAQGNKERTAHNNHGTYFDLQICAIAAFLGDWRLVHQTLRDSRVRLLQQFDVTGRQPEELKRTTSAHYCCFNLQGWIHLCRLADVLEEDLWSFSRTGDAKPIIQRGMEWIMQYIGQEWPFKQISDFDTDRFLPIYHEYCQRLGDPSDYCPKPAPDANELKAVFHPHDGLPPFWQFTWPSQL